MTEENDESSVTRVFITGLPPSLTKDQLRSHFASKFTVTDSHVVPARRIGFIGLSDHESAQNAVKYFDQSFIRMSKISVALARPVETRLGAHNQMIPVSQRYHTNESGSGRINPSKRKRDLNDDGYEGERQMRNNPSVPVQRPGSPLGVPSRTSEPHSSQSLHEEKEEIIIPEPPPSDNDWLRNKTNRLLDLEGDIESHPVAVTGGETNISIQSSPPIPNAEPLDNLDSTDSPPSDNSSIPPVANARLFVRNLPFTITEESLRSRFLPYGTISEVHCVQDTRTNKGKGLGYVQFVEPQDAGKALLALDGKDFQGRLMHILPATDKKTQKLDDFELSKLPLKQQKALKRKMDAASSSFSWNSLYMNPDAVLASVASRLGVTKAELLDPSSTDAAIKQAHAETSVIRDSKTYLKEKGIRLEAFKNKGRDDKTLLLKNFSFGTSAEELSQLLSQYGEVTRFLFPPTGTIAIAQFLNSAAASLALKQLAYRNVRGSILYLEKAPEGLWDNQQSPALPKDVASAPAIVDDLETSKSATATLFVRNLNFSTTSAKLSDAFNPLPGFLSAKVKTRTDAKRPGQVLSMGFAFVEFRTKAQAEAALATMNGRVLEGHDLQVQISQKVTDAAEERRKEDKAKKLNTTRTKIIVKNLPFEASKKDIRALFEPYGKLRTVRLPRKFDNSARGFAFAEFVTAKEAENAMDALSSTHLLGRKLVLDFAEGDSTDPEAEILAMEKKIQGHQSVLTHHRLTGSARTKFTMDAARDDFDPL